LMHGNSVERFGIGDGTGKAYGYIYEGNLANLTVVDLNAPWEIKNSKQMTRCGWSPYDGLEGTGKPVLTVIEGEMYGV
jgi:dihydroorotase